MAPVETQVLGVSSTGLAHPQPVETQQSGHGGVVGVVALGGEEEPAELAPIEATPFARVDLGPAGVLRRVRWDPTVDVGKTIEAADGRQPPVDGRSSQAPLLHGAAPQLDVGPCGLEHGETGVGAPLEERAQVVAIRLEGPTAVARQVPRPRPSGLGRTDRRHERLLALLNLGSGWAWLPPFAEEDSEYLCGGQCPGRR